MLDSEQLSLDRELLPHSSLSPPSGRGCYPTQPSARVSNVNLLAFPLGHRVPVSRCKGKPALASGEEVNEVSPEGHGIFIRWEVVGGKQGELVHSPTCCCCCFLFAMLKMEPRVPHMLGKHSTI
jgi:hypothetical protein